MCNKIDRSDDMKVWIIKKNNKKDSSIEMLKKIYFKETKKKLDVKDIKYKKKGKPFLNDNFYFNISHSKKYISIVFSNSEVGIDIEDSLRKICNGFENKILGPKEQIIDSNILNNWVIKEAFSKFLGLGLCMDLKKIDTKKVLKNRYTYNLSTENYICYVVGLEKLEDVIILDYSLVSD